jgi:hypothetical protein
MKILKFCALKHKQNKRQNPTKQEEILANLICERD